MSKYAEKVKQEREEKLNRVMTLEEAFALQKKARENFGNRISVAVMKVDGGYVLDCIVRKHFKSEEEVGDNRMQVSNEFMWELIR